MFTPNFVKDRKYILVSLPAAQSFREGTRVACSFYAADTAAPQETLKRLCSRLATGRVRPLADTAATTRDRRVALICPMAGAR